MECTVKWLDGMSFIAETGTGHLLAMDGAPDAGGRNLAPRPMELLLAGAGGCTAFDVVLILKRGRHDVRGCSVRLEAERAESPIPRSSPGSASSTRSPAATSSARRSSARCTCRPEKYCSASIMLSKTAEMIHEVELIEAD
jgi:putative redox protein